jgi:glycosyltransferase involved in cell wall biosynthesis
LSRVYVHLARWANVAVTRRKYAEGMAPDATPYGFHLAANYGHTVEFSDTRPSTWLTAWINKRIILDIPHVLRNIRRLWRADVVWTIVESDWLSISLLQRLRLAPRIPIIANTVWLFNRWEYLFPLKRILYRNLLADNIVLTVHAKPYLAKVEALFPGRPVHLMHFGISSEAFAMVPPSVDDSGRKVLRILAIGSDQTRDWQTLLDAFGNDPRFELKIVCWRLGDELCERYTNLSIPKYPSVEIFRNLYAWSDFVIVPMKRNLFSGITVLLEAVALGRPVISSDTGGSRTYFDDTEITYVPPEAPDRLREAVLTTTPETRLERARRAQLRFRQEDYTNEGLMRRYSELTERCLAGARCGCASSDAAAR